MKTVYRVEDFGDNSQKFMRFVSLCFQRIPSSINAVDYWVSDDNQEFGRISLEYKANGIAAERINDIVKEVFNA